VAGQDATHGTPFGRYRLVERLGSGGMGEVWRAYDTATNRIVAIKLLPRHLAQDDTFVKRFRREAEAAARLNSPHTLQINAQGDTYRIPMSVRTAWDIANVLLSHATNL
jgi:serine/threonine protein kinase